MEPKRLDNSSKNLIDIFIESKKFIGISVSLITTFAIIYAFLATTYYSSYISIYVAPQK